MPVEQMTSEESAAMEAMKADTGPEVSAADVVDAPQDAEPVTLAEPKPAVDAATDTVADPDKPPPGMVPQGALHQERERRKAAEAQIQEFQAKLAAIEARMNPPAEIVVPDPILEPEKFRQFQIDQIKERAADRQAFEQRQQQAAQEQAIVQRLNQDVAQFRTTTPDYDPAFQHALKVRQEELAFYGNTPDQIAAQLEVDIRAIVQQAYSEGTNPAAKFYSYAKMRGYSPAQAAAQPAPQAAAQINALAEAQRQTQTMATAGGPSSDGGVTIETLSKMTEAELIAMPRAKRDAMMQKIMGG